MGISPDIMRKMGVQFYGKELIRSMLAQLLRNPVYVQADMDIYEYFKAQGAKIESPPELFTGEFSCYLYQAARGGKHSGDCAPQGPHPLVPLAGRPAQAVPKYHVPEWPQMPQYMAGREKSSVDAVGMRWPV